MTTKTLNNEALMVFNQKYQKHFLHSTELSANSVKVVCLNLEIIKEKLNKVKAEAEKIEGFNELVAAQQVKKAQYMKSNNIKSEADITERERKQIMFHMSKIREQYPFVIEKLTALDKKLFTIKLHVFTDLQGISPFVYREFEDYFELN